MEQFKGVIQEHTGGMQMAKYKEVRDMSNAETKPTAAAIKQADENADEQWRADATHALLLTCHEQPQFTVDDVWITLAREYPEAKTHENRAMGAVMRRGRKMSWTKGTGQYIKSARSGCHMNPRQIWASMICLERSQSL